MATQTAHTSLFQQGITALKAGDTSRARILFSQVLQDDPQHQAALLWLASAIENPTERRPYLERAIAINPHNEAGKRAQSGLERLRALDLPSVEQIAPFPNQRLQRSLSKKQRSSAIDRSPSRWTHEMLEVSVTTRSRSRWTNEMLEVSVGCFGALGMFAGFLPQLLTGTLGLFFLAVGCGAGLFHVIGTMRFGGTFARGVLEALIFSALAFGLVYGCFWYFTVYLASQPLFVFPTVAPTSIPK